MSARAGDKLEDLQDKSERLSSDAERFYRAGRALKRKQWWRNAKIVGGVTVGVVLAVGIVLLVVLV